MDTHLNNGYKMAYQKVFKLKKLRKQMSTNTAMLVYKQTILPYFEYCDFLIVACSKREQDKIEKLQYRALRIIHKIRNPREVRSGFIAAIRNERVKDKKEMPPAEPDA